MTSARLTKTLVQDLRSWIGFPKKELDDLLEQAADELERRQRENEVLATEREQARQRVDFFVGLLARFWNFSPPDVKASDGRTFQFVDPDPHRTLRVIKEAMAEALADSQVAARASHEPSVCKCPEGFCADEMGGAFTGQQSANCRRRLAPKQTTS